MSSLIPPHVRAMLAERSPKRRQNDAPDAPPERPPGRRPTARSPGLFLPEVQEISSEEKRSAILSERVWREGRTAEMRDNVWCEILSTAFLQCSGATVPSSPVAHDPQLFPEHVQCTAMLHTGSLRPTCADRCRTEPCFAPTVHIFRGWGGHTVYYGGPAGSLLFGSIPIPPPTPSTSGQTEKLQESVKDEENLFDDTELRLYRQRQQMERHAQSAWEDAQRLAEHSARVEEAKKLQVVKERKGHRWRE